MAHVEEMQGEFATLDALMARLRPGSVGVFVPESIEEALAFVRRRLAVTQQTIS